MDPNIIWSGAVFDPSGYGMASRRYAIGLSEIPGVKIKVDPKYFWSGELPDLGADSEKLMRLNGRDMDFSMPHLSIQHLTPENWTIFGRAGYHIGVTTFETDGLPRHWQKHMRSVDELWTFSHFTANVFAEQGIRRPIKVIPHGVDTGRFSPQSPPMPQLQALREKGLFVFGSNFDWIARKNPDALIEAYFKAFKPDDPVVLVMKVFHIGDLANSYRRCALEIRRIRYEMFRDDSAPTPKINLITGILPDSAMPGFYTGLDCYVLPSRGEGWGLSYSEAMASGVPTMAVAWSAHTEFMNDTNSLLVYEFDLEKAPEGNICGGQNWASVRVDALAAKMRKAFEDRDSDATKAMRVKARESMAPYSWGSACQGIVNRIGEIC